MFECERFYYFFLLFSESVLGEFEKEKTWVDNDVIDRRHSLARRLLFVRFKNLAFETIMLSEID
jgi:hypothetical protein